MNSHGSLVCFPVSRALFIDVQAELDIFYILTCSRSSIHRPVPAPRPSSITCRRPPGLYIYFLSSSRTLLHDTNIANNATTSYPATQRSPAKYSDPHRARRANTSFELYTRTPHSKMVQDQDIDVYLAPYSDIGKRYPEHVVPSTSPALSGNPNEVYIEVVDGDRFVIVVDLLAAFDWKGSKMLLISFSRDGKDERVTSRTSHYSQLARHAHNTPRLQGRDVIETDVRKVDGRWLRCGFKFSQLHIGKIPTTL